MNKQSSKFGFQVISSLIFLIGMLGYTATISKAFVSTETVLKVIQKDNPPHTLNKADREQYKHNLKECQTQKDIGYCMSGFGWH